MIRDTILYGDVYACLNSIGDNSISVAITSPPYWMQRDYGFEGQIGQEKKPEDYIGRLVIIYNKLRDKLKDDGLFFLNIGDKYLNRYGKSHLLQIPYRLAHHMVKDGWILQDIIIWYKPNHMPSSVKDRFTNTYEPVLVFAKNKENIYQKKNNVINIPLQPTKWKHTAAFPEKLVEEMLTRVALKDGDLVLDPFAGTGTTGVVVKKLRYNLFSKQIYSVLIEKGEEFLKIINERTGINNVSTIPNIKYEWNPVIEDKLKVPNSFEINTNNIGEVFIAESSREFLSALKGISTDNFKSFHRFDSLYFFGVVNWTLDDLYFINQIFDDGYVLRNMIVVSNNDTWFPIFMFASNNTRIEYKFYLDRVRIKPKTDEVREWNYEQFIGSKVKDISVKENQMGKISEILSFYDDKFPKTVIVQWDGHASIEFVLHPDKDEFLMEGLKLNCPYCYNRLKEFYNPMKENRCPNCHKKLFTNINNLPLIEEPLEVSQSTEKLEKGNYILGQKLIIDDIKKSKETSSKFEGLDRINWGASPGARKTMLGEYFTKMRLYRIDQPTIARYLTILRENKGLKLKNVEEKFPKNYSHTIGHWFRTDFGGSIPLPEDVEKLKKVIGIEGNLLKVLERTALKFQTVKSSIKGRNPGDFIKTEDIENLKILLKTLYLPSHNYLEEIKV